jgi:YebC/PmpR family DNA-binding regulatory protein
MGRAFEYRKARKMKRWDAMSKAFTRYGREIAISVKTGGADPDTNARLRAAIANAKGVNMPKERIENAIKKASSKEEKDFEEILYEGYAPHGIAILVETATDNPTRTVANVRMYFNRSEGSLGTSGSVSFLFDRKGVFRIPADAINLEEMELDLIDAGAEDIQTEENEIVIYTAFSDFGQMLKNLEEKKITITNSELQWIPKATTEIPEEQQEDVYKLIEKLEEDDDVNAVYHNMKEE